MRLFDSQDEVNQSMSVDSKLLEMLGMNESSGLEELLKAGIKAAQEGKKSEAKRLLLYVTNIRPDIESAWLWLASVSEYPEELLCFLRNVLSLNPSNQRALEWQKATKVLISKTFVQRGIAAHKENRIALARQFFEEAIRNDEENELAWLWLASIAEDPQQRISLLEKVLQLNPNNDQAKNSLELIRKQKARELLKRANAAVIAGRGDEAYKILEELMQLDPEIEEAWLLKAYLSTSHEEKLLCFEKVLSLDPNNEMAKAGIEAIKEMQHSSSPASTEGLAADEEATTESFPEPQLESESPAEEPLTDVPQMSSLPSERIVIEETESIENVEEVLEVSGFGVSREESQSEVVSEENQILREAWKSEEEKAKEVDSSVIPDSADISLSESNEEPSTPLVVQQDDERPVVQEAYESAESEEKAAEGKIVDLSTFVQEKMQTQTSLSTGTAEQVYELAEKHETELDEISTIEEPKPQVIESEQVSSAKSETIEESSTSESLSHEESVEIEKPTISDSAAYGVALKSENKYASEQQKEISLESDQVEEKNEVQMEAVLENPEVESSKATTEPVEISDVGVLSEETKESTVVSPLPEELKETIDVTPASEKTQGPLILVVDDSPTVRKLITTKLERSGYRVIQAVDGLDALEKINSAVPDLVLLDITMPNLDGYEVCKRIRSNESTKNIPVVMISGKDGFFDKVRGRMVGSSGYITKPFGPETLMKTVESYIKNTQRTN